MNTKPRHKEYMKRREHDIIASTESNDLEGVKAALAEDPSCINQQKDVYLYTAMHCAAGDGLDEIFQLLIKADGLDLSITDRSGDTAIDYARNCGMHQYLDQLLEKAHPWLKEDKPFAKSGPAKPRLVP